MGINVIAAFWGLAEATLFVLVPDILLSALSIRQLRIGMIACLSTLTGALVGGAVMYTWGANDLHGAVSALDALPAISPQLMDRVHHDLIEKGPIAIFIGPLFGIPYKIFAVHAPSAGISMGSLLLLSIPARFIRFSFVTIAAWGISKYALPQWPHSKKLLVLCVFWILFYVFYFTMMSD